MIVPSFDNKCRARTIWTVHRLLFLCPLVVGCDGNVGTSAAPNTGGVSGLANTGGASSVAGTVGTGGSKAIAKAIGAGLHTCAVLIGGTVQCWGDNGRGQLGDGTTTNSSVPVTVTGVTSATAVGTGEGHTCALLSDSTVQCWGNNYNGQLGNGTTTTTGCYCSLTPVPVSGISSAVAIAASGNDTCAALRSGTVQCWVDNTYGQLGNGTTTSSSLPVQVTGITNAVAVAVGGGHSCTLLSDGTVECWGFNGVGGKFPPPDAGGDLGNGTVTNSTAPVPVTGITNAVAVAAGGAHSCALLSDGTVQCWGDNMEGELGNDTIGGWSTVPVPVTGINDASALAAASGHSCVVLRSGTVQCWGDNTYGQLGNGTTANGFVPVTVLGITNAVTVAAGDFYTCAMLSGGTIQCWGHNSGGQLGNGTTTDSSVSVTVTGF